MDNTPPILYHYCSAETLQCIVENKTLRASPLSSINDFMEHNWLKQIAIEKLSELYEASNPLNLLRSEIEVKKTDLFREAVFQLRNQLVEDPFAICFSSDGDVLSQWRAYANDGLGFAIGFTADSLTFPMGFQLRQVSYDQEEHNEIVDNEIEKAVNSLEENEVADAANLLHANLLHPSMTSKNPKFSEELEWRVVGEEIPVRDESDKEAMRLSPSVNSGFRIKEGLFVPFHDLGISNESIIEVVLGPKNPAKENRMALKRLLDSQGFKKVRIVNSEASYR